MSIPNTAFRFSPPAARASVLFLVTAVAVSFPDSIREEVEKARSVVSLQTNRQWQSITLPALRDGTAEVSLANLNPDANVWFILFIKTAGMKAPLSFHLENPQPDKQSVRLDADFRQGLVLAESGDVLRCRLWDFPGGEGALKNASGLPAPFAALCEERLYLRNPVKGHKTTKEWATDFLRAYVPGGEKITSVVKETLYRDAYYATSEPVKLERKLNEKPRMPGAPRPALIKTEHGDKLLPVPGMGIEARQQEKSGFRPGAWYPVKSVPGAFISVIQPRLASDEMLEGRPNKLKPLDNLEASSLCYLAAFDLSEFNFSFCMGTEHPGVGWSERIQPAVKTAGTAGPDGFGSLVPLVVNGIIPPYEKDRIIAAFTGGFKRYHGAFRRGDLAWVNRGSHYGFLEKGVVLSSLNPGLATFCIRQGGRIAMKTWTARDAETLNQVLHARQNGFPLIEPASSGGPPVTGEMVGSPYLGNWSGSQEGRFRTVRAGIALQEAGGHRFLLYGYFSSATPSSMARVFHAYGCSYAMQTDINALEHTYLAFYGRENGRLTVQHLDRGMAVLDKTDKSGNVAPRFLGYADNRDFFYIIRKE
ncbi:hypothetical protein ACFL5V_06805 [Fibrobacterota bacterium]